MSNSEDIWRAKKALNERLNELKETFQQIIFSSEKGGKAAIVEYLSNKYDSRPIELGNDILIGGKLWQFDDEGKFVGMSDDKRSPAIAVANHISDDGEAGDA